MDRKRHAELRELLERTEDPVARADLLSQMEAEWWGSWRSPIDDFGNRETWRRMLAAHVLPLPDAAD